MRRADGNDGRADDSALEAVRRRRMNIAVDKVDPGTHLLQALDIEIDRTGADGTAARQRDLRLVAAREERSQHPEARTDLRDHLIGCGGRFNVGDTDRHDIRVATGVEGHVAAEGTDELCQRSHIGKARHVDETKGLVGQKRGRHQRQGGVLCTAHRNPALEAVAAANVNSVHDCVRSGFSGL